MDAPEPNIPVVQDDRRTEVLLDAMKTAVAVPGEHRLFRAGRLPGLFPSRAGLSAAAALVAISDGLLDTIRTETRGKVVTEWVRSTPKAVTFVHDHESPKSLLRELRSVLQTVQGGIPPWMEATRNELRSISATFETQATALLKQLSELAVRVEDALRRAETHRPAVASSVGLVVPWAIEALEYLDRRKETGVLGECSLPELFHALRVRSPELSLADFHDGLKRLHDVRAVRLISGDAMAEPEYAVVVDGRLVYWVGR
jgi:hypothetical protein